MNSFVANQRIFYSLHVFLIEGIFVTTAVKSATEDKISSYTAYDINHLVVNKKV